MSFIIPIHSAILMLLYWMSLFFIGYALMELVKRRTNSKYFISFNLYPLPARLVLYIAASFVLFSIFTVFAYAVKLPAIMGALFYILILFLSVLYVYLMHKSEFIKGVKDTYKLIQSIRLLSVVGLLVTLLVVDFIANLYIGGYLGGDGFIHISKVRSIAENGFVLTDAYYGTVPETRHHLSVLHTLYAIPSILGIEALNSWFLSFAPLKLIFSLATFFLTWRVFSIFSSKDDAITYASYAAILTIAGYYFINIPGSFVVVWVMLFIVGLLEFASRRKVGILISASMLIAMTHSLIALASIVLLMLIFVLQSIGDRKSINRMSVITYLLSSLILLTTPVVSMLMPDRMTEAAKNYGMDRYDFFHLGDFISFVPNISQYTGKYMLIIALITLSGLLLTAVFVRYRRERIIVAALIIFVPVTIYNPIFVTLLNTNLPAWALARFTTINVLTFIAIPMTVFGVKLLIQRLSIFKKYRNSSKAFPKIAILVVFIFTQSFNSLSVDASSPIRLSQYQHETYAYMSGLEKLLEPAKPKSVVLAERYYDNFMIPDVTDMKVVAISEGNASPASDMRRRTPCYDKVVTTLDYGLISQLDVKYVVAKRSSRLHAEALSRSYLKLINGNETHELFEFKPIKGKKVPIDRVCVFEES